jgi:hypothetical protein
MQQLQLAYSLQVYLILFRQASFLYLLLLRAESGVGHISWICGCMELKERPLVLCPFRVELQNQSTPSKRTACLDMSNRESVNRVGKQPARLGFAELVHALVFSVEAYPCDGAWEFSILAGQQHGVGRSLSRRCPAYIMAVLVHSWLVFATWFSGFQELSCVKARS